MISNPPSDLLDVLVIDDEQPALDELVYLLERDPRVETVRGCDSAAEALRLLQESDVDAVFLDVQMPGLTGLDLAQVLSRFKEPPPVVFVTVVEGICGGEQLAFAIRRGPLAADLQFPYHPHVTVAHHLDDPHLDRAFAELADFECTFEAEHFSLYVHDLAEGWVPTRHFPLTGGQP